MCYLTHGRVIQSGERVTHDKKRVIHRENRGIQRFWCWFKVGLKKSKTPIAA